MGLNPLDELIGSMASLRDARHGDDAEVESALRDIRRMGAALQKRSTAVKLVMDEWGRIFSFRPYRLGCLGPVVGLLEWIRDNPNADGRDASRHPFWQELTDFVGPAESVLIMECCACGKGFVSIGVSGLSDLKAWVCVRCGGVLFASIHKERVERTCGCGGAYAAHCPSCGSVPGEIKKEVSPYEYFAGHSFTVEAE